jgi:hypothetical protein
MRSVAVDARRPLRVDVFQRGAESALNRLLFEFREVSHRLKRRTVVTSGAVSLPWVVVAVCSHAPLG